MATETDDVLDPAEQLAQLTADRERLGRRTPVPWGLAAAGGAGLAWFVADAAFARPGADYQAGGGYLIAAAVLLLVTHLIQRETGIRFRGFGSTNWLLAAGLLALTLAMFSLSLALVSLGYRWLSVLPVALTWALGTWAIGAIVRNSTKAISRA